MLVDVHFPGALFELCSPLFIGSEGTQQRFVVAVVEEYRGFGLHLLQGRGFFARASVILVLEAFFLRCVVTVENVSSVHRY